MNKKLYCIVISAILVIFINSKIYSQEFTSKFGKIDDKEFKMTVYEKDTSAVAVILADCGNSYFQVNDNEDNFQVVFDRYVRIKILKKEGFKWANIEIPMIFESNKRERITGFKAETSNLVNGKVVKTKSDYNPVFDKKVDGINENIVFTMQEIKVGSIIEYKYTIISDFFFKFRNWQFQYEIPVVKSEYFSLIPQQMVYEITMQGNQPFTMKESYIREEDFGFKFKTVPYYGGVIYSGKCYYHSKSNFKHYEAKDLPAITNEPYMSPCKNFLLTLNFELKFLDFIPSIFSQVYGKTYTTLDKKTSL